MEYNSTSVKTSIILFRSVNGSQILQNNSNRKQQLVIKKSFILIICT